MNTSLHEAHGLALQVQAAMPAVVSPIDGMTPTFSFGGPFDSFWKSVFAAVWGLIIIACLLFCLMAVAQMRSSKNNPMQHQQGKESLLNSGIALGIAIAFGVIVSAVFWVVG